QPLGVAHVVEPPELAVELPQPGVVAHPVGAQVDEPGLPHAAVVGAGGVAGAGGEGGVPVDPLHHVGHVLVVPVEEARDAGPVAGGQAQGGHAVEAHAHAHVPADDVGDGERALDHGADRVALGHVLPPAGLGAPGPLGGVLGLDGGDLVVGVGGQLDVVVATPLAGLGPLGADH